MSDPEEVALLKKRNRILQRQSSLPDRSKGGRACVCVECDESNPQMFMVDDQLWASVCSKKEFLCLPCFEKRLGREIRFDDLKDCYLKRTFVFGKMIIDRG